MARIRTIKPEFFTSEDTVSLSPLARLLYIALWCEADKAGRMIWKPATLKLRYLPGDQVDIGELCAELIERRLVLLYGESYACIPSFPLHQHVNPRETPSRIPDIADFDASTTREPRVSDASSTREPRAGRKGKEGKGKEGKELTTPDGVVAASGADDQRQQPAASQCPHSDIIALYHHVLPQCPKVRAWTPARATQLRARWNEDTRRQNLEYWQQFFAYVASCDFLVGKGSGTPFFADLEWITKSANFTKIREGKYENRSNA